MIQNKAVINEESSGTILLLKNEIKKLKNDLKDQVKQVNLLESEQELLNQQIQDNDQFHKNNLAS